jgi:SAM-dependent methyltransferase
LPDDTRPQRSQFNQLVSGIFSRDSSLRRVLSHPGGQNAAIVFSYFTSVAYDNLMLKKHNGISGKEVFGEKEWISPKEFLKAMNWGGENGEPTKYATKVIRDIFLAFAQDGALEMEGISESYIFRYKADLDYPSDEQLNLGRTTNKFLMYAAEDLIDFLVPSLKQGYPAVDRHGMDISVLWESLQSDPLIDAIRTEYVYQTDKALPIITEGETLSIIEIGSGAGKAAIELIDKITDRYNNITVELFIYEEIPNLLTRARNNVNYYLKSKRTDLANKNIDLILNFDVHNFNEDLNFEKNRFNLVLAFQIMHYIPEKERRKRIMNLHKVLKPDGKLILGQSTSYSKEFPYPFTLLFSGTENFDSYPTAKNMESYLTNYFKKIKSVGLDSYWIVSNPKLK